MTKPKPSDCRFAYESLDVCLHSSVLVSFCVVHCAFLFNGFVCFFVFVFLTLNQKWGLVNMAVSVAVYVCMHFCMLAYMRWTRKVCCLFVCLLVFLLVWFLSYGEYGVGQCVSALSVCYWNVQPLTSMSQTKPTKQHHWLHSSEPPLSEQVDIFTWNLFPFSFLFFFYYVNFLHWQSILELKSWVWSYYLFDSLVFKVHDIIWWHRLSIFT